MESTCKNSDYIITFGKHNGKTLGWIADNFPGYIVWLVKKNVLWVNYNLFAECQAREANRWDTLQDAAAEYGYEDWGCRD